MTILEVKKLKKKFGDVKAVNDISFSINQGCCFGLLGPNGAGKTTTIEIIEGITEPDGGCVVYKGDTCKKKFTQEVGVQFQSTALIDSLSAMETLKLFSSLYKNPQSINHMAKLCDLEDFIFQSVSSLSGGQRQRLLLAIALIHDPEIIFLDEPTTGLDPRSRYKFWALINKIKSIGKTIILTTHYMDEAEKLCDELVVVDRGSIVAQGSPKELLKINFGYVIVLLDASDCPKDLNIYGDVIYDDMTVTIQTDTIERTLDELIKENVNLSSLNVRNPTLDDLFLKLTGCSLKQ